MVKNEVTSFLVGVTLTYYGVCLTIKCKLFLFPSTESRLSVRNDIFLKVKRHVHKLFSITTTVLISIFRQLTRNLRVYTKDIMTRYFPGIYVSLGVYDFLGVVSSSVCLDQTVITH